MACRWEVSVDGFTPIGNTGAPVPQFNGLQSISSVLGIAKQKQELEGQAALVQQEKLHAAQAQGVQDFFRSWDPSEHIGADGTTDVESVHGSDAYKKAGNAKPLIDETLLKIRSGQLQNKQALTNLDNDTIGMLGRAVGPLVTDQDVQGGTPEGRAKIDDTFRRFASLSPQAARVAGIYGGITQKADPRHWADGLYALQLQAGDVATQRAQQNPAPVAVNTGAETQFGNRDPRTGQVTMGSGASVQNTIAPGVTTGPGGQLVRIPAGGVGLPNAGGGGGEVAAPNALRRADGTPRTAADDSPGVNATRAEQDAYRAATEAANAHVSAVRAADDHLAYGTNMLIANRIRELARDTRTGPGTQTWHTVLGALGAPAELQNVADYQTLGAYLDRQAAGIRGSMGLPQTNEGAAQSRDIAGNTQYQQKAIIEKNDLTQALIEGAHRYRMGLDRVAGFSGQASPSAVNAYRNAWTSHFDPNVYRGEMAFKRGKGDADDFMGSISGGEAKSLREKRKALQALESGNLPQ